MNAQVLAEVKTLKTMYVDLNDNTVEQDDPRQWSSQGYYKYGEDYITIPKGSIFKVYREWEYNSEPFINEKLVLVNKHTWLVFNNDDELMSCDWLKIKKVFTK